MDRSTQNTNLFKVLERGDKNISLVQEQAIILVGLTRQGKSTTFNWLLNKSMIGVKSKRGLMSYEPSVQDQQYAILGAGIQSVTLAPNIYAKYKQGVSLVDMAGFKDSRDYVSVIGVSYFLNSIFSKARKVKFLIVISESDFGQSTGQDLIKVFSQFIKLFNFKSMKKEHIDQFKNSTAVLVTKATPGTDHREKLNQFVGLIQNETKLNVDNRQLLIKLIDHIIDNNMIENFDIAVQNVNSPPCKIEERLEKLGWANFDLDAVQKEVQQKVISIPFSREYEQLKQADKKQLDVVLEKKTKFIKQFAETIGVLMNCYKESWANCLDRWAEGDKIKQNYFDMSNFYIAVDEFLNSYDDYDAVQALQTDKHFQPRRQELVPAIENIIEMHKVIEQIGNSYNEVPNGPETIQWYTKFIPQIFAFINYFSSNQTEQHKILSMEYVILTGLTQMSKIYQLNQNVIHSIKQELPDQFNSVQQSEVNLKWNIITDLKDQYMIKAFPSLEALEQYEKFFQQFYLTQAEGRDPLLMSQAKCSICSTKAEFLLKIDKKKAVENYVETLLQVKEIMESVPDSALLSEEQKEQQLNQLHMKNFRIIKKIINILKDIPKDGECILKVEAIRLCKYMRLPRIAMDIYQNIVKDPNTGQFERKAFLDEYIQFAIEWGFLNRAYELLHYKLELEEYDLSQQEITTIKIKEVLDYQNGNLLQAAKDHVSEWKRIPLSEDYDMFLKELKSKL